MKLESKEVYSIGDYFHEVVDLVMKAGYRTEHVLDYPTFVVMAWSNGWTSGKCVEELIAGEKVGRK